MHDTISMLERPLGDITLGEAEAWLQKLLRYNDGVPWFEPAALRHGLAERWFEICYTHPQPHLMGVRQFWRSSLASSFSPTSRQQLQFWLKAVRKF